MAAPGGAAAPCACTNISIMQLFHELKQQFPAVPDRVVSDTISTHCHDRSACRRRLECEAKNFANHQYPSASLSPRKDKTEHSDTPVTPEPPKLCPNRPSITATPDSNHNEEQSSCAACKADKPPEPKRPTSLPLQRYTDYPLNVSFNVNCQMNMSRQIFKPHPDLPAPFAVNLTVCTPTSIDRPQRPLSDDFEGNVRITVNSAPSRSTSDDRRDFSPLDVISPLEIIIRKQKTQLERLEVALKADRARLYSMRREVRTLQAPPPSFPTIMHLQYTVQQLHASCQRLTQQLDDVTARTSGERMENLQRERTRDSEHNSAEDGGPLWQCHVCTFDNQPMLNKCEMCDMPRIILVHGNDEITVQLHPVYNKIAKSWI